MELGSALLGEKVFWHCPNTSFLRTHKLKGNAKLHITSWLGRKSSDKEVAEEREKKAREFFEKLKEKEKARVQQMEELQRKMVIQNDLEAVQASEWSKLLAKWQGASKGTPWDPEPAFAIPFSDFWKLLEANTVQFMEYDNLGQDVAVVVPYFEDAKDAESVSEKSKNASDAKGVESASEKNKDSSDVESASGKSKNGSDILDRPIVFKRHKVTQMPADCWTDIWGRLHQQLIHVQVNNTRSSVAMQIYPTLETVVIWGMRVAVAMLLYIWLQRTLYPWYKPRDPNDRPRYKPARLSYFDLTGLGSLGQSRARFISAEESTGVTFDDFAGQEYVKRELQEVVKILKDTGELRSVGIYCPKGVLLYGPPGTGKTLLAKAIAGEAGVPFFSASGSEFVEMFVGVAAARVRDLFSRARQFAPAIIFIDEIDAIGAKRGGPDIGGGGVEREQGLIQILTELDGFWTMDAKVLVVGATNRLDMLDPALLRKGRFDKVIHVGLPTEAGRLAILRVHARNKGWASESEKEKLLREVASLTVDHSGAELQNILNEASILSARKDKDIIEREELLEALKRQEGFFKTGEEDVEDVSGETRMRVAYREAAIAVLECYFPNPRRPFSKTTIRSLDIVPNMEYIDSPSAIRLCKKSDIIDSIIRTCAPRVVEDQIFGKDNVSWISGASLEEAGILIDYLILQTGMTALGKIHYQTKRDVVVNIGPKIQALRDEYLRYAMEKCAGVLKEYRSALETIAAVLLEKLDLEADEIWDIFNKAPRMPQPEPAPIDEYGSLIYCGRWGIYGVTLPGRVTFNPGSSGFATFGAPRPQQLKVFHDDTWKLMDSLYKKRVEDRRKKKGESFKQEMPDLISQQIL